MKPYSQILHKRAWILGVCFTALLGASSFWFASQTQMMGETVFLPTAQVDRVLAVTHAVQGGSMTKDHNNETVFPCTDRPLAVLKARIMLALNMDADRATDLIDRTHKNSPIAGSCSQWVQAFQTGLSLVAELPIETFPSQVLVEQELSEDVTWARSIPCLLAAQRDRDVLLTGSPLKCSRNQPLSSLASLPINSSYRTLAHSVAKATTMAAVSGQFVSQEALDLTLDTSIQSRLDLWTDCIQRGACSDAPSLNQLRDVSIVILDARNSSILGSWCHGLACERALRTGSGVLPATLVEAPPASTAKLFFAMHLASIANADRLTIQRQIKTSGQLDSLVTKRNEWWERQAICDSKDMGTCLTSSAAKRISDTFGFNQNCLNTPLACGRVGLISTEVDQLSPALIGRIALSSDPNEKLPHLSWKSYDDMRQGKRRVEGGTAYTNTSRAVQGVLGAGDSRISALGLSVMSMQIWRLSQGLAPTYPAVVKSQLMGPETVSVKPSSNMKSAARVVLGGMRMAIEPEEPGWQGAGTVSNAFFKQFKKPCRGSCGVAGKTGTVSQKDPGFAGASVYTGIVHTQNFQRWLTGASNVNEAESPVLAIGVIAIPKKGAQPGHAASQIAMAWMDQHLAQQGDVN